MVTNLDVLPKFKEIILKDAESILDIGCGGTSYEIYNNRNHDWWNFFDCKRRIGIDIWEKEIEWRKKNFPNDTFYVMNAIDIDKKFKPKSFDIVHCQNVVEHLEKDKAIELIKKMEKIAKRQVILGTPKGFRSQGELRGNPFEVHKFAFTKEELESLGYVVFTIGDYYFCYKNLGEVKNE